MRSVTERGWKSRQPVLDEKEKELHLLSIYYVLFIVVDAQHMVLHLTSETTVKTEDDISSWGNIKGNKKAK